MGATNIFRIVIPAFGAAIPAGPGPRQLNNGGGSTTGRAPVVSEPHAAPSARINRVCGEANVYDCQQFSRVEGDQYVAIITDGQRASSRTGARIPGPKQKDEMGRRQIRPDIGILFIGIGGQVYCHVGPGWRLINSPKLEGRTFGRFSWPLSSLNADRLQHGNCCRLKRKRFSSAKRSWCQPHSAILTVRNTVQRRFQVAHVVCW